MSDLLLENEVKRLKNLKNFKDYSDNQIQRLAKINLKVKEFRNQPLFDASSEEGAKEQELAEQKFKSYLEVHELESQSEIDTLRSLIYTEIFEYRIQNELNKIAKEKKYPPEKLTSQLTEIQNQKLELKVKLGIDSENQNEDELTGLEILRKRFEKYINLNKEEFTLIVPYTCRQCGNEDVEMKLLRRRVKDFDCITHPWFVGRWFWNYEILKDVKSGKISKEDAWRYLCSASKISVTKSAFSKEYCVDYIDYLLKNWAEIVDKNSLSENE